MPLPKPRKNESKNNFMSRCMSNSTMNEEYSDNEQRYAVCNDIWNNKKEKKMYNCECLSCGHKLSSENHCKDISCPECGGEMRRVERPGPGKNMKKIYKELINTKRKFDEFGIKQEFKAVFDTKDNVEEKDGYLYVVGYACTSDKDWVDDIITEEAMQKSENDLLRPGCTSVLFNHDENVILGKTIESKFDGKGIKVKTQISNAEDVANYRTKIKEGILNSFSIRGLFKNIEIEKDSEGNILSWQVKEMDLMEVSLVGLPCNKFASVIDVMQKSLKGKSLTKKVSKKAKNSSKTNKQKNERSGKMADSKKKELILDVLKEHSEALINDKVEEVVKSNLKPIKEQMSETAELIKKSLETKKEKAKESEKEKSKGEEIPAWAKSITDSLGEMKEKLEAVEKESTKRKGYQRDEDDDGDEDNDTPKKALKNLEDEDTVKYVEWLSQNGDEYSKLPDTEREKAKGFMFAMLNELSKSRG